MFKSEQSPLEKTVLGRPLLLNPVQRYDEHCELECQISIKSANSIKNSRKYSWMHGGFDGPSYTETVHGSVSKPFNTRI
jgi:hypothetical protein